MLIINYTFLNSLLILRKISVEIKSDKIQNYCTHKLQNYDQLNWFHYDKTEKLNNFFIALTQTHTVQRTLLYSLLIHHKRFTKSPPITNHHTVWSGLWIYSIMELLMERASQRFLIVYFLISPVHIGRETSVAFCFF